MPSFVLWLGPGAVAALCGVAVIWLRRRRGGRAGAGQGAGDERVDRPAENGC